MAARTNTAALSDGIHSRRHIAQNFILIWLDASIDASKEDYQNNMVQLRSVVNDVNVFTEPNDAVDFLTDIDNIKSFLILTGTIGQQIISSIHNIPQLDAIYILYDGKPGHEQWIKEWVKIKGVHTNIESICKALRLVTKQCDQDSIAVSLVCMDEEIPTGNLNQLEPSFMYTQIFKEILLEIEHNKQSIENFIQFWRYHYIHNAFTLKIISEFERDYCSQFAIMWYTREYFIYHMLNRALRTLDADILINMGFFIRDLHEQIEELHRKQVGTYHIKPLIVYRGQGLSGTDFEKLQKTKNGLLSFNNFLSTSPNANVSRSFAESASKNTDTVGVLFKITIDPSISSAPFASIQDVSYFQEEEEILFSMHSVFRVGGITKLDNTSSLYQVDLELTADDDQQLRILTERIRSKVGGEKGWQRLGHLLIKLNHFDKAEELYNVLLEQVSDLGEKAIFHNNLGFIKNGQGDYTKAIEYYNKALEMLEKTLPPNHRDLAPLYHNIGRVYINVGEYSKALSYYEKGLDIRQKTLPSNHPDLATSYSSIGTAYRDMGQYSKALLFGEKALKIRQNTLPGNHPDLATTYGHIGVVYENMGEYAKALSFYKKAFEIQQKTLPSDHPTLAYSYNSLSLTYFNMGDYQKALSLYEKAFEIWQKTLPSDHPQLVTAYNNMGSMYNNMGEYSKALSFHRNALAIQQKAPLPNHDDLTYSFNNIGLVYYKMGEYSEALTYLERALNIFRSSLSPNHPNIKAVQTNIERIKRRM